jgi:single-strand DNA-binding protein
MSGDASIAFSGNLIADPELRFLSDGTAVCSFVVAVNSRTRDKVTNEWKDGTATFFRCSAWRNLAENIAASVGKGDAVAVSGTITAREYESADGEKRLSWEVRAASVAASLQFATATLKRASRSAGLHLAATGTDDAPPF